MAKQTDTKVRIQEAARAEFLSCGYENASLRRICQAAGTSTGSLYFFFKDKAELYDSLVHDMADQIYDLLDTAQRMVNNFLALQAKAPPSASPPPLLQQMDNTLFKSVFFSFFDSFIQNKDSATLLLRRGRSGSDEQSFLDQVADKTVQVFSPLLEYGKSAGHLDSAFTPFVMRTIVRSAYTALADLLMSDLDYASCLVHLDLIFDCLWSTLQTVSARYSLPYPQEKAPSAHRKEPAHDL